MALVGVHGYLQMFQFFFFLILKIFLFVFILTQ